MYIRWIVRKHKNAAVADVAFHDAYLVESYRDERDNPRQRTICYLGNIRQISGQFPSIERELFFLRADRILAGVPDISGDDRLEIAEMLRQKVPALTPDEVMEAFRNNLRWYVNWWRERGATPTRDELFEMIDEAEDAVGPM
ncbi:MAG: hypothetical protein GFH27_549279n198 [Chloroflexi bacterium AL-W]|nr:hypothetical protein [Chloroflexi bacterium AL-N1]NOK65164.1 hypothetical protein [Chloroflexi bacterium AL-N10]NOK72570.1 hypothetical protein [Chloroflexi bacterium AL-N5]NOK79343.1 hypothetical protein [Chloroflexi bacterium AL-W]NOK87259.1 hypothetical protein [Chloroflexi bacterium AL-N15]